MKKTVLFTIALLFVLGCDDDADSNNVNNGNNINNTNNVNNTNNTNNVNNTNNTNEVLRVAQVVHLDMHAGAPQKVDLMNDLFGYGLERCDFGFIEVADGITGLLCPGVTAYNMGADADFYDVTEPPANAEFLADEGDVYVIGTSFQSGGTCETGYTMTDNIYILQLEDGSMAKMTITAVAGGQIYITLFRDPAGGSDLTCDEP